MARTRGSYRSRRYDDQPRTAGQPPWLWLTTGLLVGFFLGLLYAGQIAPPGGNDSPPPIPETLGGSGSGNAASPTPPRSLEAETREPDAASPEAGGPRFEFYEVLPNGELPRREPALADHQPEAAPPPPAAGTVPPPSARIPATDNPADPEITPPAGSVMLQVASFQNPRDAGELKANLALIGQRALVQRARINGVNWYRVRLGPFTTPEEVSQTQARLKRNGLESIVVRY